VVDLSARTAQKGRVKSNGMAPPHRVAGWEGQFWFLGAPIRAAIRNRRGDGGHVRCRP
jgi:hypothetical protein